MRKDGKECNRREKKMKKWEDERWKEKRLMMIGVVMSEIAFFSNMKKTGTIVCM